MDGQASSGDVEGCESRMLTDGIGSQQRPVLLDGCREIVGEVEGVSHPKDRGHNRLSVGAQWNRDGPELHGRLGAPCNAQANGYTDDALRNPSDMVE